ncbi:MAG: ferrous iron transport protein B [Desulfobacteraceae bacterium]|nr:ferrous iron transport protein B [Desulfobacteraceae bacterium]
MRATIALAGNPNSGKTTLFNELTGARQHVGNYPGITVEKKQGVHLTNGHKLNIVDLPGTYSLTAYSLEEVVARQFLINEKPRAVINIIDASNLERNLYLTLQFMELGIPVCVALNMMDVATKRGIRIDTEKLSDVLQIPIIPTIARTGEGKTLLMDAVVELASETAKVPSLEISYGEDIDRAITEIESEVKAAGLFDGQYPARWIGLKYLENDDHVRDLCRETAPDLARKFDMIADRLSKHIEATFNSYPEAVIADHRYGYIKSILKQNIVTLEFDRTRFHVSDAIDRVVTSRFIGPLIMAAVIYGLYHVTFAYSEIPVGWLESVFGGLHTLVNNILPDGLLKSMIISGVIDGVGGVLGFVPLIMFMFFGISFLEDTGYLARVAFMLDRLFRAFGLHGSSVMPFIVSGGIAGGCAVPGVMAARTLRSPKERLATLLTAPFMNCGAKLPVFALLVAAFFADYASTVMFLLTVVAWTGALLVARLLRSSVIKGESTPFVMELPPYRLPTLKGLLIHTWERTWQYIRKAGTVILGISILLWAAMTFPNLPASKILFFEKQRSAILAAATTSARAELEANTGNLSGDGRTLKSKLGLIDEAQAEAALRNSVAGRIGTGLEGISRWAGFDWRTNIALVGGFAAKEVIVSTLGTAYSMGDIDPEKSGALSERLGSAPGWNLWTAVSMMVFIIFYAPCFVTVVCISREAGSWKWGAFSMIFNSTLAFTLAVAVYQIGTRLTGTGG